MIGSTRQPRRSRSSPQPHLGPWTASFTEPAATLRTDAMGPPAASAEPGSEQSEVGAAAAAADDDAEKDGYGGAVAVAATARLTAAEKDGRVVMRSTLTVFPVTGRRRGSGARIVCMTLGRSTGPGDSFLRLGAGGSPAGPTDRGLAEAALLR